MASKEKFLEEFLRRAEVNKSELARMLRVTDRTIRNWLEADEIPRSAIEVIAREFVIPEDVVRAAAAGAIQLTQEYVAPINWKRRRAGKEVESSAAPTVAQPTTADEVPIEQWTPEEVQKLKAKIAKVEGTKRK